MSLDDKDEFAKKRTPENDKLISRAWLECNPGNTRLYEHCGKQWQTNNLCPPVVLCPECGVAIAGIACQKLH